jgi:hypothetical protein
MARNEIQRVVDKLVGEQSPPSRGRPKTLTVADLLEVLNGFPTNLPVIVYNTETADLFGINRVVRSEPGYTPDRVDILIGQKVDIFGGD